MKRLATLFGLAAGAALLFPATASAQQADPYVAPPVEEDPDYRSVEGPVSERIGLRLSVGGGVVGFADSDTRDYTSTVGGSWDVRLGIDTRSPVSVEIGHNGSLMNIDAIGLDDDARLLGAGLDAIARVNIIPQSTVQPYVFGGAGWKYYDLVNTDFNTSNVANNDNVLEIPVGGGVTFGYRGVILDLRGTYRAAFNEDLIGGDPAVDDGFGAGLDTWEASLRGGFEF